MSSSHRFLRFRRALRVMGLCVAAFLLLLTAYAADGAFHLQAVNAALDREGYHGERVIRLAWHSYCPWWERSATFTTHARAGIYPGGETEPVGYVCTDHFGHASVHVSGLEALSMDDYPEWAE